jgi:hypothetical protein
MTDTTNLPPVDEIPTVKEIKIDAKNILNFKTLPFRSKARICWGFFWRSIVLALGASLTGGIIGGILGGVLGVAFHFSSTTESDALHLIQIICGITGLLWGCVCFYFYIRWLLTSKLGNYRLLLVHAD